MMDADLNQAPIDDCWNRIGVFGDKSCARLDAHIHCRNCEVYSAAAIALLDRYSTLLEHDASGYGQAEASDDLGEQRSLLIFRLGEEWLALATRRMAEVMPLSPIHSLPHQKVGSLLGVTNVRGTLVACLNLGEVLGLEHSEGKQEKRAIPRMLILETNAGPLVSPVDEVSGIQLIPLALIGASVQEDKRAISRFSAGVLQWGGKSITLLDDEQLLAAMTRSLA
ncbi:MAG: chemotaxis protein CheW [Gammaproteobacteria bacterium HGW-Gammaproteobacteria-13]|nr:MAG: chemotaxis protein CheW [Gammaproteobacteria bacterium HGW-Gammaproteobacteria-13]